MAKTTDSKPIPVRVDSEQRAYISALSDQTGLTQAELIRRGLRALKRLIETSPQGAGVILELAK